MQNLTARLVKWNSVRLLLVAATILGNAGSALAGGSWFSKAIDVPSAVGVAGSDLLTTAAAVPTAGTKVFDLVISVCKGSDFTQPCDEGYPQEDSPEYSAYEEILDHWADAVCEQSNGALRLGKIRVFRNGTHHSLADVKWFAGQTGRPVSDISGFGVFGSSGQIEMYDAFDGNNFLNERQKGGYALGHEFAHYVLGLYEEYSESLGGGHLPRGTDIDLQTIMGRTYEVAAENDNYSLLNHSIPNSYDPDSYDPGSNPGCSSEATCLDKTAQGRVYGKSAWEVLISTDDALPQWLSPKPDRVRYAALESQKPQENGVWQTQVNLTTDRAYCREKLDPIWMDSNIEMQLIIDRSGSMIGTPIERATTGAGHIVDSLEKKKTALGVVAFDAAIEQLCLQTPCSLIGHERILRIVDDKDVIDTRAAIKAIDALGETNYETHMYDGAALALSNLQSYASTNQTSTTQLAFLLSDGLDEISQQATQASVESSYSAARVPLSTFAYGTFAPEGVLLQMAQETGASSAHRQKLCRTCRAHS